MQSGHVASGKAVDQGPVQVKLLKLDYPGIVRYLLPYVIMHHVHDDNVRRTNGRVRAARC